ncbi:MAG: STAS domain-containing protein [Gammaproteobacteria bacterium]|nr:STAS domain-containing protein [Gammaproteobacteria bacterium]
MATFMLSPHMTFETVMSDRGRLIEFLSVLNDDHCVFDLSDVLECDSAGLAFLIEAKKISLNRKIKCHFEGLSDNILSFIRFFGVEEILEGE